MRADALLAGLALLGCSAVTTFDPVGLPCDVDEHCPGETTCGADFECVERPPGQGGGGGVVDGGDDGFPTSARVAAETTLPDVGAPVGLTDGGGGLLVADFVDDRIATTAGGTVCTLPDVGIKALAALGGDVFTLHTGGLYRVALSGCGSARLDPSSGGEDIDTDEGVLLELDGDLVRVRSPETGVVQRQVELVDAPSALARLGAAEGVWYLAANPGGRLELHVYDATGGRTLAPRVRPVEFGARGTGVAGLYAAGSRVWLLARGGDYGSATLVELRLE